MTDGHAEGEHTPILDVMLIALMLANIVGFVWAFNYHYGDSASQSPAVRPGYPAEVR